jgi:invasion protein IalB
MFVHLAPEPDIAAIRRIGIAVSFTRRCSAGVLVAVSLLIAPACLRTGAAAAQAGISVAPAAAEATYSPWRGECSTSRIADVTCAMRKDARSGAGGLLGFVVFGAVDRERFLTVAVARATPARPVVVAIDGVRIPDGTIACRGEEAFCSIVLRVDDGLLDRLMRGSALTIEREDAIELRFPLQDFARSRGAIL